MSTFERHVLDNGLRILTADLPHAQSVTCMVMIAAGSRYETAETNGMREQTDTVRRRIRKISRCVTKQSSTTARKSVEGTVLV